MTKEADSEGAYDADTDDEGDKADLGNEEIHINCHMQDEKKNKNILRITLGNYLQYHCNSRQHFAVL